MDKIVRQNGYVYLVKDFDRRGFETFTNLGKDPEDPMWHEEIEEMKKTKKSKKVEEE